MKKFLLPVLCAMMALSSCLKESTFTVNNYSDYATYLDGKLITDEGSSLTVIENAAGDENWRKEDKRMFILCDILNRSLDIRLKSYMTVNIPEPLPVSQMQKEADDPIEVLESRLSGGYLNLAVRYYFDPSSNYARGFQCFWSEEGNKAQLFFFFDGNHESPVYKDEDALKQKEEVFSIPLKTFLEADKDYTSLEVTIYEMNDKKSEKQTYTIYTTL